MREGWDDPAEERGSPQKSFSVTSYVWLPQGNGEIKPRHPLLRCISLIINTGRVTSLIERFAQAAIPSCLTDSNALFVHERKDSG